MKSRGLQVGDQCPLCDCEIRPTPLRAMTVEEILNTVDDCDEVVSLVIAALRILCRSGKGERERACWRLADALWLLGQEYPEASGIATPTGRGSKLE